MVPVKNKVFFINYILDKKYLLSHEIESFLKEISEKQDFLQKIYFYDCDIDNYKKYKLHINMRKNTTKLYIDNVKKKNIDNLFFLLLNADKMTDKDLIICFIEPYQNMYQAIYDSFENYYMGHNELFNAYIKNITKDIRKKDVMEKVDKSLKDRNFDDFIFWSNIYKNI